jgi:hypothetical protein
MRRISLAVAAISTLVVGLTVGASTSAVPAKFHAPLLQETSAEPTEQQMRRAFEGYLAALVSGTLALVAETGGADAVRTVKQRGNDRFEVRSFHKVGCTAVATEMEYRCSFTVDVAIANGTVQRAMTGHFMTGPAGVAFAETK